MFVEDSIILTTVALVWVYPVVIEEYIRDVHP